MNPGKQLENVVKASVEELVQSGALGLTAECCRVFLNKGYFSRDRGSDIVVDVSIELTPRGRAKPSVIWVWECKDYTGAVSVAEIEEFHAKLEQIGADRTKGTFVTTGHYQKGAIEYASAKGIGLVRVVEGRKLQVERVPGLYLRLADHAACERALTQQRIDRWDTVACPLPEDAVQYVFALHATSLLEARGFYGVELSTAIARQLVLMRDQLTWLTFPPHSVANDATDNAP